MAHLVGIVSGKGGVGKTTTAINLGLALTKYGRDTLVLDGNIFAPNLGLYLGVPFLPITLHDAIQGKNHITEAAYLHPVGLKIIPSALSFASFQNVDYKKLSEVLQELKQYGEIILVDTYAELGKESASVIKAVDKVLVVTNPDLPSMTDALRAVKVSEKLGKEVIGVVVNKVKNDKFEMSVDNIRTFLGKPVYGVIRYDENAVRAVHLKQPLLVSHPDSKATEDFYALAANLIGKKKEAKAEDREQNESTEDEERLGVHELFNL